jgi:chemotaxis receptor (MCP) glutamine deamidase CheD
MWVADTPAVITTILGSCVSVCLWSESVAGINHFILPRGGIQASGRYGSQAKNEGVTPIGPFDPHRPVPGNLARG